MRARIMTARLLPVSILLPALFLLHGCGAGHSQTPSASAATAAVPVAVAAVRLAPIAASYVGTAALEADHETDIVAKTGGVLLRIDIEEGDTVRAGQVLAELDGAQARLAVDEADATLKKLRSNFARSQELYQRKLLSQKDYDQLRYDLEAQQAVYQQKVLALSWTRITAPIGGVISRRMVKRGNLIQTNQALFHIVDMRPLLAVLHVPERELGRLQPGQTAHLAVDALGRHDFTGGVLRPGMFARIAIIYDQRRNALVIPRSAVVEEDGRSTVYVVVHQVARLQAPRGSGGREQARAAALPSAAVEIVRRVVIRTGYGDGDRIEVLTGLKRGDRVVTLGQNNLRDGTAVTVVERAP